MHPCASLKSHCKLLRQVSVQISQWSVASVMISRGNKKYVNIPVEVPEADQLVPSG